ncbi:Interphotoreceptor matrix proteoglycan 2 [Merluccius polli]|uniref:Interphotoreceptor matrix proteoglycan 2 n=1 Tax=Merluccius polli TaxID=89951 RepID=A0AA47M2X4_MERPO|nr:Interphotoreceptor matrix proteoglycan 2 [Merluccius polli]
MLPIGNEIGASLLRPPRPLKEQVVELYIRLRGETFTNALRDPSSSQHLLLSRQFTRRIQDAFDKLPGFKNVYVTSERSGEVVVVLVNVVEVVVVVVMVVVEVVIEVVEMEVVVMEMVVVVVVVVVVEA